MSSRHSTFNVFLMFLLFASSRLLAAELPLTVSLVNLGSRLQLQEVSTSAGLSGHAALRYFNTADGAVVAMANRLLVVVNDRQMLARIVALPEITDHALLAELGKSRIELLETADVATALALLPRLAAMPGVLAVQPDLSQNAARHSDGDELSGSAVDLLTSTGLREAWQITHGKGVRIAIIDTGIDLQHRDLRGVKLVKSFDVDRRTRRIAPDDPRESHGTGVAGLIFARHNGFGIDGIAPDSGLIAIRLRSGWTSSAVIALQTAAESGADIINCSWTFPLMLDPVAHVVDYLSRYGRQGRGVLLIVAAGNKDEALAQPQQFAAYPGLLAVSAVDKLGSPYGVAHGARIFIAAPGLVRSTSNRYRDSFTTFRATSAAAAVVSGVSALMLAANPQLNRAQIEQILIDTADRSPPGEFVDGRSPFLGAGRIQAGRAVAVAANTGNEK